MLAEDRIALPWGHELSAADPNIIAAGPLVRLNGETPYRRVVLVLKNESGDHFFFGDFTIKPGRVMEFCFCKQIIPDGDTWVVDGVRANGFGTMLTYQISTFAGLTTLDCGDEPAMLVRPETLDDATALAQLAAIRRWASTVKRECDFALTRQRNKYNAMASR